MMRPAIGIALRRGVPADASRFAAVGAATFLESFAGVLDGEDILHHGAAQHDAAIYRAWLQDQAWHLWLAVAQPGDAPVGYLAMGPAGLPVHDPQPGDLEIKRIYLLHRFHGLGLGKRLMAAALTQAGQLGARRLLLGVYAHNDAAIAFYRGLGFEPAGQRTFRVGERDYDDRILALSLATAGTAPASHTKETER